MDRLFNHVGVFWYVVTLPINVLQMAPLFFFGATLIFIGYDLLYKWVRFWIQ
jgi:hypothetical protein